MEDTLYDQKGHPIAYIAFDDDAAIYLWSGHAVAYAVGETIFGWNGLHLGWYVDGILFDRQGRRVGSLGSKCSYALFAEPAKYAKYAKHAKFARHAAYARPAFSSGYSKEPLDAFLKTGAPA